MSEFTLPIPPTVNNLYFNVQSRGRVKSAKYKDWIWRAKAELLKQKPEPVKGPFSISYAVPVNNRRDLANHEKALTDLLVAHEIVPDDRYMQHLSMFWADRKDVLVVVEKAA